MRNMRIFYGAYLLLTSMFAGICNFSFAQSNSLNNEKPTLRFYLVRHGQTYSNIKEATIGGGGNAQLTPKGRRDAFALGLGFKEAGIDFQAVYSSNLQRAYETASQILAGQNSSMKIKSFDGIQDISWGAVEGGRIADLKEQYGVDGNDFLYYFGNFFDKEYKTPVPGTESTSQFSQRFEKALRLIGSEHEGKTINILVTAHSTIGFYLSQFEKGVPRGTPNTSASIIEYKDDKFTLIDYGNTAYLERGHQLYDQLKPLQIVFITNPETIFKTAKILEGTSDSNLNPKGIQSAKSLQKILKEMKINIIYSSDLNRSRRTYEIALPTSIDLVHEDPRLNELFLGYWETEKYSTLEATEKENFTRLLSENKITQLTSIDGGAENINKAIYRFSEALNEIVETHQADESTVVIFTHPFILKAFMNQQFPGQCSVNNDQMQIIKLNYKEPIFKLDQCETLEN